MRFGLYVPNFGEYADPGNLMGLALDAEAAGWDGFFIWDHLLLHRNGQAPIMDAWIAIAAVAARTERMLLGPMITPAARRRPWKLAREVVSLDHLSNGRVILGVGLGTPADAEFECFGESPDDRIRAGKLDEALAILQGLWRGEPFRHQGEHFTVNDVTFLPRPVQSPRIPIWVAGFWPNKAPIRRAARWDGVFPLKRPAAAVENLAPGAVRWSSLWLGAAELKEISNYAHRHRANDGHFDLVASGATPADDQNRAQETVKSFEAVGATWWLEWLDDQRGSFSDIRHRVRVGPPKV